MATKNENVIVCFVYDFETGGLDCNKHPATQISMHAVRLDTFEVTDKYSAYIYPYRKNLEVGKPKRKTLKSKYDENEDALLEYQSKALEYSAITMDMLYSLGKAVSDVCKEILDFIKKNTFPVPATHKPFLVGQNPWFDEGFMQQIMCYTDNYDNLCKLVRSYKDFWGNKQIVQLDTIVMAQLALGDDKSVSSYKLEAISERLGIDLDDAHDADADVTATRGVVKVLTERMRSQGDSVGISVGSLAEEKRLKTRDHFKI